jgi:hypothetical protein
VKKDSILAEGKGKMITVSHLMEGYFINNQLEGHGLKIDHIGNFYLG